jgi:coenzyme Q-binding protein COQ10
MHSYTEKKVIPYKAELINQVILDVERYPEFLPWCSSARIISKKDNYFIAELKISFKGFAENYKSRIISNKEKDIYSIEIEAISGPFEFLKSNWKIRPIDYKSEIDFSISFQLKSKILNLVIGAVFGSAVKKVIDAFEKRIKEHNFI